MTRRDWYLGVVLVACALLFHAAFPRYEIRQPGGDRATFLLRVDRWTGTVKWIAPQGAFVK